MSFASIFPSIKRFRLLIILALITALVTVACNPSNYQTKAAQVPQMIVAVLGEPSTFNPALNESAYSVFGPLYDSLINENPLTNELEPGLAES
ncbi:hypothetical protein CBP27_22955, partial [Fischerella thermalis WC542]